MAISSNMSAYDESSIKPSKLGILDYVNPLYGMTSDPFLYYYGARIGLMGHQMSGLLASEKAFARNLRIPLGMRNIVYGGEFAPARYSINKYSNEMVKAGVSSIEKKVLTEDLTRSLLKADMKQGWKNLFISKNVEGFKLSLGGRAMGFFAGYTAGKAFGLGDVGSVAAGVGGVALMSRTGGIAKALYDHKLRRAGLIASEISVQPSTRVSGALMSSLFGISEDKIAGLGISKSIKKSVYEYIYGAEAIHPKGIGFLQHKIPSHYTEGIRNFTIDLASNAGLSDTSLALKGLGAANVTGVFEENINNTIRQLMFKKEVFPIIWGRGLGRKYTRKNIEKQVERSIKDSIRKLLNETKLGYAKGNADEVLKQLGFKGPAFSELVANLKGTSTESLDDIVEYAYARGEFEATVKKPMAAAAMKGIGRQRWVAQGAKMIGMATTASLLVHTVTAGLRYSMTAAEGINSILTDIRRPDFGKGNYIDSPTATSERQLAMQSIQNALGLGRSLLGNEAAYMH